MCRLSQDMGAELEDERLVGLVGRAQVGDPAAFDDIVRGLEQPLLGFARAHNANDPDGVANEVLLRAFRGIVLFEGGAPQFRAWIFQIARNVIADEHRAAGRRITPIPLEPARMPEIHDTTAPDRIEEIERVRHLLRSVPRDQKDVLVLRIIAGLSVAEVAEVLGKRPGAIRALQHRGLERLRREIALDPSHFGDPRRSSQ